MKKLIPAMVAISAAASLFAADALETVAATADALAEGISEDDAKLTNEWQGKVAFGLESTSGNTDKDSCSGHAEARKLHGQTVVIATLDGAWEETEVDGEDERTKSDVKGEINLKQRFDGFFVYGNLSGEHDHLAGIKYRFTESLGLGTYLIDTDELKFSVEAGIAEVEEKLQGADSDEYTAYRLAERADWIPGFAEGVSFYEKADFLSDFDDSDHYFANAEAGVDIPMFAGISLTVKGYVEYNHQPAEGFEKSDRGVVVQVGYNF